MTYRKFGLAAAFAALSLYSVSTLAQTSESTTSGSTATSPDGQVTTNGKTSSGSKMYKPAPDRANQSGGAGNGTSDSVKGGTDDSYGSGKPGDSPSTMSKDPSKNNNPRNTNGAGN